LIALTRDADPHGPLDDDTRPLADLERLLDRWTDVLRAIITGTGIATLELDWLWATRRARKPLAEAFAGHPDYGRLTDADLDACIRRSSEPGNDRADRTRRSRAGACAAFRFDLEDLARGADPGAAALMSARSVFIGPAEPEGPYHRPKAPISPEAFAGFKDALTRLVALCAGAATDGPVERLRRDVLACGLNKSILRLLPAALAGRLEHELDALLASRGPGHGQPEEAS
jgi:hypothetical protein